LAEYLQAGASPLKRNFYDKVAQFVDEEMRFFAKEVAERFGRVLAVVGATTEVAYVFGGGAGPVKAHLYPALLAKATEMNSVDAFPTLYLDSSYSRHLNREGLYIASEFVDSHAGAAAAANGKRSARPSEKKLVEAAV
jgi:plasmid segregation protein ParM